MILEQARETPPPGTGKVILNGVLVGIELEERVGMIKLG